jgi:hypothetical protein
VKNLYFGHFFVYIYLKEMATKSKFFKQLDEGALDLSMQNLTQVKHKKKKNDGKFRFD